MKKQLFFLAFIIPVLGFSQEIKLTPPEASFLAILVGDMETASKWYREVMGFTIANENRNEDRGIWQQNLHHDNIQLELIQIKGTLSPETVLEGQPKGSRVGGFFKFGMKVPDFDAWIAHLEEQGANFHGRVVTDPISEKRMVIVKDPDGNRIQLFEK